MRTRTHGRREMGTRTWGAGWDGDGDKDEDAERGAWNGEWDADGDGDGTRTWDAGREMEAGMRTRMQGAQSGVWDGDGDGDTGRTAQAGNGNWTGTRDETDVRNGGYAPWKPSPVSTLDGGGRLSSDDRERSRTVLTQQGHDGEKDDKDPKCVSGCWGWWRGTPFGILFTILSVLADGILGRYYRLG